MKRLILIDAHAVIHRAYHALPPLTTPAGEPSHAVYGFTTILLRILRELKPDYIAAAFDLPGPTFRHLAYERYKAQRPETPSDLASQFPKVKEVLAAFGIPVFEKEGYEADDIIGTVAKKLEPRKDLEVEIVTGDMDALQLVRPRLKVYSMKKGISETTIYDEKTVKERYGLKPSQLTDFKGLRGDPSDNIPGVKGVGEKTATELLQKFGGIEGIYKALRKGSIKIPPALSEKLSAGEEDAKFSRELARINQKVALDWKLENVRWSGKKNQEGIRAVFRKFGFFSLLKRWEGEAKNKPAVVQSALPAMVASPSRIRKLKTAEEFKQAIFKKKGSVGLILMEAKLYLIFDDGGTAWEIEQSVFSSSEARSFFGQGEFLVHDGKSIIRFLRGHGVGLGKITFDLMLAAYVAGVFSRDLSYAALINRELGRMTSLDPREELGHFFEIVRSLESKLSAGKLGHVFREIELPLVPVLAAMEERGILLDCAVLRNLSKNADEKLRKLTQKIYALAGGPFNINSSQQLAVILFEKLKIRTAGLRKTPKGGVVSTGAAELEKLKGVHPVISEILEYREYAKLKTTYLDALPELVDFKTGRLHTTLNQTGTATGRLSSSDPNLQNIPVLSKFGREVRKAFVAPSGFVLASFDYSQIELRVAAHIAQDKKMIDAFRQGLDIHKITASEIYNVSLEKVTPELRRAAKTLNFGILYGMGPQALAENTGMSREEAKKFIDEYFHDFAGIKNYLARTIDFAKEHGYVETIFGRRRYIPEVLSSNWRLRSEGERMAINMPVQGSATGDIIKLAMIKVEEWARKEGLESEARMLLQVHDELLFEIRKGLVKKIAPEIKKIMENVVKLNVPLVVDVKTGGNWGAQTEPASWKMRP